MSDQKNKILEMVQANIPVREICKELGVSSRTVCSLKNGTDYIYENQMPVRGLNDDQKLTLENIAINKDVPVNTLLLSYIKAGMNSEPEQNKIYKD